MKIKTSNMAFAGLFAALTAAGAFISIPVGPVPVTLQNLFAALAGILLGPSLGALAELTYLAVGLCGLPVFAGGVGGPAAALQPAFGYLLGFVLCPIVAGRIAGHGDRKPSFLRLLTASATGMLAVYALGLPYMAVILQQVMHTPISFSKIMKVGFLIFLPGDAAKCLLIAILGARALPALRTLRH